MKVKITINDTPQEMDVDETTPLLWILRDYLEMTGTKYGCGMAYCGACTVMVDGIATRSCVTPIKDLQGKSVTTIEGNDSTLRQVQDAWKKFCVPQCGYCQSGQIMAATALIKECPSPTETNIDEAMSGNLCRCGTYPRIKKAILSLG